MTVQSADQTLIFQMYNNGTTMLNPQGAGTVLVGTSAASGANLQVRGKGTTSATTALRVENSNTSASLVVLDDGSVGIGTASPSALLSITGNASLASISTIQPFNVNDISGRTARALFLGTISQNNTGIYISGTPEGAANIQSFNSSTTAYDRALVLNYYGANVGIGRVSPTALLHISGASSSSSLLQIDSPASSSILFVSGSGFVGVGTNNPVFKLDVSNPSGYSAIGIQTAASTNAELQFKNAAYSLPRWTIRASAAADGVSGNLVFQRFASTFPMTITSGDNVLIGTSTDSARLMVKGSGTTSGTTTLRVENANASASLSVLDNGFTSIGTNTPISLLHMGSGTSGFLGDFTTPAITFNTLNNGIYLDSNRISFKAGGAASFSADSNGPLGNGFRINAAAYNDLTTPIFVPYRLTALSSIAGLGGDSSGSVALITSGSTRLYVSSSGNVGIGTITPAFTLDVSGSTRVSDMSILSNSGTATSTLTFFANGNTTNSYGYIRTTFGLSSNFGRIEFGTRYLSSTSTKMTLDENGNLGIGISLSPSKLYISGSTSEALLIASSSAGTALFVSGSGNVGIGTSTPTNTLDVNGTARVQNTLTVTAGNVSLLGNSTGLSFYGQGVFFNSSGRDFDLHLSNATSGKLRVTGNPGIETLITDYSAFSVIPTLAATVNSQILTGVRVNNTFTQGAFTGLVYNGFRSSTSFTPSGSSTVYNAFLMDASISQSSGANGITRGLYINPSITSSFDFRAIETTAGNVLFQSGSTPLMLVSSSGVVSIGMSGSAYGSTGTSNGKLTINNTSGNNGLAIRTGETGYQLGIRTTVNDAIGAEFVWYDGGTVTFLQHGGSAGTRLGASGYAQFRANIYNPDGNATIHTGASNLERFRVTNAGLVGIGTSGSISAQFQVKGSGTTNATTTFLLQNSTPTNLLSVLDNGQVAFTSPTMSLAASQSAFSISPIISASNIVGGQYYGVSITPTFFQTTGSQTETAFRVAATFTSSNATATTGSNIIADFGSTSAGSQLTVTDVTSGSIYMVNDVSGIPIIEATSNWDVNIYDFPNKVFEKTGSQVNIYGTMRVSGSFILPLSQSTAPQTGSAYWSGSLLFIYNGTRYMSASFA
jgi:hypothetical protein